MKEQIRIIWDSPKGHFLKPNSARYFHTEGSKKTKQIYKKTSPIATRNTLPFLRYLHVKKHLDLFGFSKRTAVPIILSQIIAVLLLLGIQKARSGYLRSAHLILLERLEIILLSIILSTLSSTRSGTVFFTTEGAKDRRGRDFNRRASDHGSWKMPSDSLGAPLAIAVVKTLSTADFADFTDLILCFSH